MYSNALIGQLNPMKLNTQATITIGTQIALNSKRYNDELFDVEIDNPMFAVHTNLLYWLGYMVNVGVQVPLDQRWSVGTEFTGGWWKSSKERENFRWSVQMVDLEFRYWIGDRTKHKPLTGWYVGPYVSVAQYDIQVNTEKRNKGNNLFMVGGVVGRTMPLTGTLNLDLSLSGSYNYNDVSKYSYQADVSTTELVRTERVVKHIVAPFKARVALSWTIGKKRVTSSNSEL